MSIDLNWETLTGGPDGAALAENIRDFIHTKFQSVQLPRFIKSVTVHDFEFGTIPPQVVLKDICDPLPDFYEENATADEMDEDEDEADGGTDGEPGEDGVPDAIKAAERRRKAEQSRRLGAGGAGGSGSAPSTPAWSLGLGAEPNPFAPHFHAAGLRSAPGTPADLASPFMGLGVSTPGVPGGTSNMHYFPSHFGTGWSGAQTPLAAMAGAQHLNGWLDSSSPSGTSHQGNRAPGYGHAQGHRRNTSQSSISVGDFPASLTAAQPLREKHSVSTLAPTSVGTSRPPTRDTGAGGGLAGSAIDEYDDDGSGDGDEDGEGESLHKYREPRVEDMQAVFRIKYAGDIKLMLTAEILLDYPMPSFVGIPVKLNITGLSFDGVGVVANIRKRVHFCFLSPEDALAAVGDDDDDEEEEGAGEQAGAEKRPRGRLGGLLQEIKVESEIGQREGMKQSLKNVGKVERFVLEQVRRIFEEEFVYPSFWTFLV